ncbi:MAG: hypothetical protein ACRC75_02145 [Olsenella sp.]
MSTTNVTRKDTGASSRRTAARHAHATATQAADDEKARREQRRGQLKSYKRPLIVLAVILVVVAALYAPARTYYSAWRTNGILQSSKDAIDQSNSAYESDNSRLMSSEGIQDEARKRGYVSEGETGVKVEGLDESSSSSDLSSDSDPWYITVLDFVFSYQKGSA